MTRWVVLLRGVNVGGGNKIAMPALRASCEQAGFERVATYIQSGNLVLDAGGDEQSVVEAVRELLADRHALHVPVVVREATHIADLADRHPGLQLGIEPKFLHVQFLDRAIDTTGTITIDPAAYAPDTFEIAGREIFTSYPNGSGRSKLTIETFERAYGVTATARNVNTVRALVDLANS